MARRLPFGGIFLGQFWQKRCGTWVIFADVFSAFRGELCPNSFKSKEKLAADDTAFVQSHVDIVGVGDFIRRISPIVS